MKVRIVNLLCCGATGFPVSTGTCNSDVSTYHIDNESFADHMGRFSDHTVH